MTVVAVLGRVVVFFLSFAAGTVIAWAVAWLTFEAPAPVVSSVAHHDGWGGSSCKTKWQRETAMAERSASQALRVESKPRPGYTDEARMNNVQGVVVLRVEFLSSGEIGSVEPVRGLPDGLTEQAIEAARRIRFVPKTENGKPVTVTRQIEYTFSIY